MKINNCDDGEIRSFIKMNWSSPGGLMEESTVTCEGHVGMRDRRCPSVGAHTASSPPKSFSYSVLSYDLTSCAPTLFSFRCNIRHVFKERT